MADNLQISNDLTKIISIEVKDTSFPLRKFLLSLLSRINELEKRVESLENV